MLTVLRAVRVGFTVIDGDIIVSENLVTGDVQRLGLTKHGVMGALTCLLPLKLCRKVGKPADHLVRGVVEGTLPFFEVEEYPDTGIEDLL